MLPSLAQYSQEVIDRYFALNAEMQKILRIAIQKRESERYLVIKEAKNLGFIDSFLAMFGQSSASFRKIVPLCLKLKVANRALDREISRYNATYPFWKRVPKRVHRKLQNLLVPQGTERLQAIIGYDLHLLFDADLADSAALIETAAKQGSLRILKMLLSTKSDYDVKNALQIACAKGHIDVVRLLLKYSPTIKSDWNLFTSACRERHFDVAYLLLERFGGVEAQGENKETPLIFAAKEGEIKAIQLLLTAGALIDYEDQNDYTALTHAASLGQIMAMKLLLEQGAKITPATIFAAKGQAKRLLAIEKLDSESKTCLMRASEEGNLDEVQKLLSEQALVNAKGIDGKTALHFASMSGHTKVVELLIKHGAEINKRDKNNETALANAAKNGHLDVVKCLLLNGANSEIQALANAQNDVAIALLLVKKLADRQKMPFQDILRQSIQNESLRSGIWKAYQDELFQGRLLKECAISQTLLEHHPHEFEIRAALDLILTGKESEKAPCGLNFLLFLAIEHKLTHLVKHLVELGASLYTTVNGETPLILACRLGQTITAKILLEKEHVGQLAMQDNQGKRPFEIACQQGYLQLANEILKIAPSEQHLQNTRGQVILHIACMQGKADLVKILLSHEIEIDQRDNAGRTPLGLASAYGHSEVVKLLLNQKTKPDINVRDHFGISPIERAIFGGHLETAKLLLEAGATMTKSELKRQMGSIDALLQGRTGVRASIKQKERIFKTIALLVSTLTQTLNEAEIFCEEELKLTPSLQKEILKSYPHSMK